MATCVIYTVFLDKHVHHFESNGVIYCTVFLTIHDVIAIVTQYL